jgi:hypothetical protein
MVLLWGLVLMFEVVQVEMCWTEREPTGLATSAKHFHVLSFGLRWSSALNKGVSMLRTQHYAEVTGLSALLRVFQLPPRVRSQQVTNQMLDLVVATATACLPERHFPIDAWNGLAKRFGQKLLVKNQYELSQYKPYILPTLGSVS